MVEGSESDELTGYLLGVVRDPGRVHSLHELLGPFCHESRNHLNLIKLSLYIARREKQAPVHPGWLEIEASYAAVERLFLELQAICRPMALTPIRASLADLIDERQGSWEALMARSDRTLELAPPAEPVIGEFDPSRLGEGLDALIAWRARVGDPGVRARLGWRQDNDCFRLDWEELVGDRFGMTAAVEPHAISLALPLLARIVTVHGGTLELERHPGLHVKMRWPTMLPSTTRV